MSPIPPPAPNKDQIKLTSAFFGPYLGLILVGGQMAGCSLGPCESAHETQHCEMEVSISRGP